MRLRPLYPNGRPRGITSSARRKATWRMLELHVNQNIGTSAGHGASRANGHSVSGIRHSENQGGAAQGLPEIHSSATATYSDSALSMP
ncbi:hypothetical protein BC628DRAFT_1356784 [Trametes gibbosa]|nr:hypothetical protein BC628DRAFT_1356784 [Trametes gibbosa]